MKIYLVLFVIVLLILGCAHITPNASQDAMTIGVTNNTPYHLLIIVNDEAQGLLATCSSTEVTNRNSSDLSPAFSVVIVALVPIKAGSKFDSSSTVHRYMGTAKRSFSLSEHNSENDVWHINPEDLRIESPPDTDSVRGLRGLSILKT